MALLLLGSYLLLRFGRLWLSPPLYLGGVLFCYGGEAARAYLRERVGRRRIKQAFAPYLPPALVEQLASDSSQLQLGGENREMTVMFCDIRGFTTLSEGYKNDPARLVHLMNRYFTAMTQVIHKWSGKVDNISGIASWPSGTPRWTTRTMPTMPVPQPWKCLRACPP